MASLYDKLSAEKLAEIESFVKNRITALESMRKPLDDDISEEVELYNNIDQDILNKKAHEEKHTIPYGYTIVQTMVARLVQTFFGKDNYLKIYVEKEVMLPIEKYIQSWLQEDLDDIKLKDRSRDFLEDALVQRTTWLQLRPVMNKENKLDVVDFNILSWFDVWFDTTAKITEDTDFVIRKRIKMYKMIQNQDYYFNIDVIKGSTPPNDIAKRQVYESQNNTVYYEPAKNNVTDEVELKEWYGYYDLSDDPDNPDFQPIVAVLGNDLALCRIEDNNVPTKKKVWIFPVRPMRQANSLIGKSVMQVIKPLQKLLNQAISLGMDNFKLLVKLLFKYKKDGAVDFDELFARGGNAIGVDDPDDVTTFDVPNMQNTVFLMINMLIQFMQQTTGAVDYVMGTSAGRGVTETARGIDTITEQALYKFNMMAENVYGDLKDFINYLIILYRLYGSKNVVNRFPDLAGLMSMPVEEIERSYLIDIGLNDLAQRRDVERAQFINAINIIGGMLQGVNGNMKELLKQVMERLEMDNINKILEPSPEMIKQQQEQMAMAAMMQAAATGGAQTAGGSNKINPQADVAATPDEVAYNQNTPT